LRPPTAEDGLGTPFDHTSIIKTVQELFGLGAPLTALPPLTGRQRAAAAGATPSLADSPARWTSTRDRSALTHRLLVTKKAYLP
jgi:hypothetical protein